MLGAFTQDSIQDLIKKSRQNTSNFNTFMNKSLNDITKELNSKDKDMKLKALIKLIFVYLNFYDIQWASFNSMEVMSTGGAEGRRYSYIITQLQFKNNKDFIQLIPNQIRSDLKRHNLNYINSALNFLNSTMNYQMANELLKDIEALLNINNNLIRKKVIVALTLACEQFAKVNNYTYWDDYLIKLITLLTQGQGQGSGISICIISSIQRMCKIAPKQCITVFVELMDYFTKCEVNWNLIKIIDIFGMLFTSEPKFTKKKEFIKILSEQLVKTKSRSVEAELVKLVMKNFDCTKNPNASELIQSSEERLKLLIFSQDNNLLVLSLRILKEIFENNKLSHSSYNYINDIVTLLNNNNNKQNGNAQILRECIKILQLIVSKDNFVRICEDIKKIIPIIGKHAINAIIDLCSKDSYSIMETHDNFTWFIGLMFDIAEKQYGKESEERIAVIIRDLSQRIESLREVIVGRSVALVEKMVLDNQNEARERSKTKKTVTYVPLNCNSMVINNEDYYSKGYKNHNNNSTVYHYKNTTNDSLMNISLFIIGEYANGKDTIAKAIDIVYNGISINGQAERYHVSFLLCLMKLIIKGISSDNSITISKDAIDKYARIKYEGNDIESIEANNYFSTVINHLSSNNTTTTTTAIEQLKKAIFSQELKPLASKANIAIKPPQNLDLSICLPINDKEIQIAKKSLPAIKEDSKVSIDKTLYTPQLINSQ